MDPQITDDDLRRFWAKVEKRADSECWLWTGKGRVGWGYGALRVGQDKSATTAQRASWRIHRGGIAKGMCVLHICDVPLCVNPRHLRLGTRAENQADMLHKGRNVNGSKMRTAKLDEFKVLDIRRRYAAGEHPAHLAREYNIDLRGCWFVIQRKTWKWVCLPGEKSLAALDIHQPKVKSGHPKHRRVYEKKKE